MTTQKPATEKQASFLASLCQRGGWETPDLNGISSFVASRMIDCAQREFDPARIDAETGDELIAECGDFQAWHRAGSMPRQMKNLQIVNVKTGEVFTKGVTFTNAHRMVEARDMAARTGQAFSLTERCFVGIGPARIYTTTTITD